MGAGKPLEIIQNKMGEFIFNKIEEAIEDIRLGKVIIVVDDEDRENEGDFICAAELITPEIVNFMATHGRGLICAPLPEDRPADTGEGMAPVRRGPHAARRPVRMHPVRLLLDLLPNLFRPLDSGFGRDFRFG